MSFSSIPSSNLPSHLDAPLPAWKPERIYHRGAGRGVPVLKYKFWAPAPHKPHHRDDYDPTCAVCVVPVGGAS
jgi:hypothetical protein